MKKVISVDFRTNQQRLMEYIQVLKNHELGNDFNDFDLCTKYFIVLHNFLLIENQYFEIVKLSDKEINRYLCLQRLESVEEVIDKFRELYSPTSKVRLALETFDNIEPIRLLLPQLKDFYNNIHTSIP